MRHLIKSILFCFLLYNQTLGQWTIQNTPTTNRLRNIYMIDINNGWTVGNNGTIIHTTDGGTNWVLENSGTSQELYFVRFPSSEVGWAVGDNGVILKYNNGQWIEQQSGTTNLFHSCYFADTTKGWVTGLQETTLKTTDGGNSWQSEKLIHDNIGHSVYFINSNTGWLVTEGLFSDENRYGIVFKTVDGGNTWIQQFSLGGYLFNEIYFLNQNIGWIVGTNGLVLRTDDGGNTWNNQFAPTEEWLYSIYFTDQNQGWLVGHNGTIFKTVNGGYSWNQIYAGVNDWLYSIQFIDQNIGWIAGDNGRILHTINGGGIPVELVSFKAETDDNDILLSWITATETNNKGFEIERKSDKEFEKIGFVNGSGTTTEMKSYTFNDENLPDGKYYYRLQQIDFDGTTKYSNNVDVEINVPRTFNLQQNYPNPFNPNTTIKFTLPYKSNTKLEVFNSLGQNVATLVNMYLEKGNHSVVFNANDLPSGVYYYRLATDFFSDTKKLIVLK